MSDHSRLSPSARYRWQACPASVKACEKYEGEAQSPYAIDGTHTHTVLEYCLKSPNGIADAKSFVGMILSDHEGHFTVDNERAARVQVAVDYVRRRMEELGGARLISESRVNPETILQRGDMSGTVDVQLRSHDLLEIIDYKDGMNPVEVIDNPQLEQYAIGVLAEYMDNDVTWPSTIVMTIVQPKLALKGMPTVVSHTCQLVDFLAKIDQLTKEAAATDAEDAPFVPGEKQCGYCPHSGNCSAANAYALQKSGIKFEAIPQQAANKNAPDLTDEQLREMIESAPLLRKMLEAAEEEALRRITSGKSIAGLKVVRGPGRRAWSKSEEEVAEQLKRSGVPQGQIMRTSLVSPAQVQTIKWENRKGEQKQLSPRQLKLINDEFITVSEGKMTVVPEHDRRSAIEFGDIGNMFKQVPVEPAEPSLPEWLLTGELK